MARILKTGVQARLYDAAPWITEVLLCALDSAPQDISVRSLAGALLEHVGKVVRTHSGDCGKVRKAEIVRQVVVDMLENTLETMSRQASSADRIYRQRIVTGFAMKSSCR